MQEHRGEREVDRRLEVGVGEDDVGVLAAEFERDPLDGRRGRGHDPGARRDAAGERDQVDVRVLGQRRAGLGPGAEHQIGDAGGQPGLLQRPHQQDRGRRRQLARLEHEGVAGQQRRGHLPGRLQQRVVPRRDQSADADRLVDHAADRIRAAGVDHPAGLGAADAGVVAEARRDVVHVVLGFDEPLAGVERLGAGEILAVAVDQVGGAQQHVRPFAFRRARPRARVEGLARRGDRGVGVLGGCLGDCARPAGRRRDIGFRGEHRRVQGAIHPRCTDSGVPPPIRPLAQPHQRCVSRNRTLYMQQTEP